MYYKISAMNKKIEHKRGMRGDGNALQCLGLEYIYLSWDHPLTSSIRNLPEGGSGQPMAL